MAHLFVTQPSFQFLPVFFNVDEVVGDVPAVNKNEDVLLVQFFLKVIGRQVRASELQIARLVQVTGVMDKLTIDAIEVLQVIARRRNPATVVDGRVSPARGGAISYGGGFWTIAILNNFIKDNNFNIWPRIDLLPDFPSGLKLLVSRSLSGVKSQPDPFASQ